MGGMWFIAQSVVIPGTTSTIRIELLLAGVGCIAVSLSLVFGLILFMFASARSRDESD